MEALAAISLLSNIVQFVEIGDKVIKTPKEVRESSSGTTLENERLQRSAHELQKLCETTELQPECHPDLDHQALQRLAQECRRLSEDMRHLIQSISGPPPRSRINFLFKAYDTYSLRKPLKGLEERLHKCRVEYQLQYTIILSKDIRKEISSLADTSYSTLLRLDQQLTNLQRGLETTSISPDAQTQLQKLLGLTDAARNEAVQHKIRKSLEFPEMRERSEIIPKTHRETFAWLLCPDDPPESVPRKLNAQKCLCGWLASGGGIFHIIGKPGSGKSTLMKFIANDLRTSTMLSIWANPQKLIIAKFFFWKPAPSRLPRSVPGLLRMFVFDILKVAPELTSIMFPAQWAQMKSLESLGTYECDISAAEVELGFENLPKTTDVQAKYRFCFFIDALDELDDELRETHRQLVDRINRWTTAFPKVLKICVSSREFDVFEYGFNPDQKVRLQDLTRDDMLCVAYGRLRNTETFDRYQHLPSLIVARSEGVFLWATLVLENICQGVDDGWDLTAVEVEIKSPPIELDDLYSHLLRSISKTEEKSTSAIRHGISL